MIVTSEEQQSEKSPTKTRVVCENTSHHADRSHALRVARISIDEYDFSRDSGHHQGICCGGANEPSSDNYHARDSGLVRNRVRSAVTGKFENMRLVLYDSVLLQCRNPICCTHRVLSCSTKDTSVAHLFRTTKGLGRLRPDYPTAFISAPSLAPLEDLSIAALRTAFTATRR